ncbi:MAG: GAF domain-containing sensor histidine kinase [Thermostichales cyanobacterium GMQP_bins_62]
MRTKVSKATRDLLQEQVTYEVLLNMIIQDIRSSFDLPEILQRTALGIGEALHCSQVHVGTYDALAQQFTLSAHYGSHALGEQTIADDWRLAEKLQPFPLPDPIYLGIDCVQAHAVITRPRSQSPANGIILIAHRDPRRQWQEWELSLTQAVAEHLGVLLAWHELLSRQQEDFWIAQTIHRISTSIRQTLDVSDIVNNLCRELISELQLPILQIWDWERGNMLQHYVAPDLVDPDLERWLEEEAPSLPPSPEPQLHRSHFRHYWVYGIALAAQMELRTASRQALSSAQERVLTAVARSANSVIMQAKAQQQMAELNHLKSSLISNVSHELRTPLTSILLLVSSLAEEASLQRDPEALEMLNLIKQESQRLSVLISDLLDYSRLEADKTPWILNPVDLQPLCRQVDQGIRPLYDQKQQPLHWHIPSDLPAVLGIPERITQVLVNLLTNAHKFSPPGSPVRVEVERLESGRVRIAVEDRGKGIPAEELGRIFERFAQVKGTQGGTGLGLAICREIVQRLGGEIGVESTLGQGSCFWFTLQLAT